MTRTVTLVLVDAAGVLLGAMPPFPVARPWWPEVAEFASERRQVLRLLHAERPVPHGGAVTYLAETDERPDGLRPVDVDLGPHPRRAPYAEVGGPAAALAWARDQLSTPVTAVQQRTWNLSAIWRLNDAGGAPVAWLKQVPSFFAHEPAAIALVRAVAPDLVPPVLATGPQGRTLLAHVPGADRHEAGLDVCEAIAAALHPVQAHYAENPDRLVGIPDWRWTGDDPPGPVGGEALDELAVRRLAGVAADFYGRIDGLRELIDGLPKRLRAVRDCGVPDTLLHGDLHPGNVRTDAAGRLTILDWGDSTVGHPAFDIFRLAGGLDDPEPLLAAWAYRWRQAVPGSDPRRAAELLRPVAALRAAAGYADFLAAIEPSEWPYHAADVPACLSASIVKR